MGSARGRTAAIPAGAAKTNRMRSAILLAAAVATLSGQITDRTTGQPLAGIHVVAGHRSATTNADGRYVLRALGARPYTLRFQSRDVPPQSVTVTLRRGANRRDFHACSTTLDYGCGTTPSAEPGG